MIREDVVEVLALVFAALPDAAPPFTVCRSCRALTVAAGCAVRHDPTTPTDEEIAAARLRAAKDNE